MTVKGTGDDKPRRRAHKDTAVDRPCRQTRGQGEQARTCHDNKGGLGKTTEVRNPLPPFRAEEGRGGGVAAEDTAETATGVVFGADDAFGVFVSEVDILAPHGQYVSLAYIATEAVTAVVPHHTQIRVHRRPQSLEHGHALALAGRCRRAVIPCHSVDKSAASAVCYVRAPRAYPITVVMPQPRQHITDELARRTATAVETAHDMTAQHTQTVTRAATVVGRFDDRTDHFRSLGVVLQIDLVRVERDMQHRRQILLDILYKLSTFRLAANETAPVVDKDNEAVDMPCLYNPLGEYRADEVCPYL